MRCGDCPLPAGARCRGETLRGRCGDPRYRAYFARRHEQGIVETGPDVPYRPTPRAQLVALREARSCLYREQCGCVYAECWWKARKVTLQECVDCLKP